METRPRQFSTVTKEQHQTSITPSISNINNNLRSKHTNPNRVTNKSTRKRLRPKFQNTNTNKNKTEEGRPACETKQAVERSEGILGYTSTA